MTAVGADRQEHLEAASSFETIVERIAADMRVLCCHQDPLDTQPAGFRRLVYCLGIAPPLFDQFFNSRVGY